MKLVVLPAVPLNYRDYRYSTVSLELRFGVRVSINLCGEVKYKFV